MDNFNEHGAGIAEEVFGLGFQACWKFSEGKVRIRVPSMVKV